VTPGHHIAARWLALTLGVALAVAGAAWAQEESPDDLPQGKGREEAFYGCTACHGFALVRQQGMSRERWDETIDYMSSRHNMPALDAADRALILDYLAANFPPRQRGRPNPFLNR
jgi:mono/diheme cytochrome c family protein